LTGLVKATDKFAADNKEKRMAGVVVLLAENSEANQAKLAELDKKEGLNVPLTVAVDGAKGPGVYKLNADVPITVLVVRKNKVQANFALAATADEEAQKKEISEVLAAAAKMIE
jgi:hypothetical protein